MTYGTKLPAVSRSKGKQVSHTRRVMTRKGPKEIRVNKGIKKDQQNMKRIPPTKQTKKLVKSERSLEKKPKLEPKVRFHWTDIMNPDDGTALPISVFKPYTHQDVMNEMEIFPTRNLDEFYEEYVQEPLKELNEKGKEGEITKEEAKKEFDEIVKEANNILYDDEAEPDATIQYSNPENTEDPMDIGTISRYTSINADGIDVQWVKTGGWRGYNQLVLPEDSPWEILHSDNILGWSEDAKNLYDFNELLENELKERGIEFAKVFTTSSNVFSQGYDFLVEKGKAQEVKQLVEDLKQIYRREEDYMDEFNPLSEGTKAAKKKGLSRAQIEKMLEGQMKSEKVKEMLNQALDKTFS